MHRLATEAVALETNEATKAEAELAKLEEELAQDQKGKDKEMSCPHRDPVATLATSMEETIGTIRSSGAVPPDQVAALEAMMNQMMLGIAQMAASFSQAGVQCPGATSAMPTPEPKRLRLTQKTNCAGTVPGEAPPRHMSTTSPVGTWKLGTKGTTSFEVAGGGRCNSRQS